MKKINRIFTVKQEEEDGTARYINWDLRDANNFKACPINTEDVSTYLSWAEKNGTTLISSEEFENILNTFINRQEKRELKRELRRGGVIC